MRKLSLFSLFILLNVFAFAQPTGKWATSGNAITSGDFIGTTNNFPLDFRTNNNQVMSLDANGNLSLKNLIGSGNRILLTDANGNISSLPQGSSGQFLLSNGTWANLPAGSTSFNVIGNDLFTTNSGNFGIGTSSPSYKLDVFGDARISNNLYVGGGIVITNKVDASVEVKAGDIIVNNDLNVSGNTNFFGAVTSNQGILFDNISNVGIKYQAGSFPGSGTFIFGKSPASPLPACASLPGSSNTFQLGGNAQIWDPSNSTNPGLLNLQTWAGGSSIDASTGGTTSVGALLLNYFCGSNTSINTGANGGSVYVGKEFYADRNSQIGANWLALNPGVALNIFENSTTELLKLNSSTNSTKLIASNNGQFEVYGDGKTKIGSGPNIPYRTLTVNGDASFANYGHPTDGLNAFEIIGNASPTKKPLRRGISVDNDPNGYINFYINSNQSPSGFNFKDGNNDKTLLTIFSNGTTIINSSNTYGDAFVINDALASNKTNFKVKTNGKVYAREIFVQLTNFPDYVFKKDYKLMPLSDVEEFVKNNSHLPNIPSAKEIQANGANIGEIQKANIEKTEELYLYLFELNKKVENLQIENEKLKQLLNKK